MRSNTSRVASATTRRGPLLSPDVHHCTPHRTGVDLTGHTAHHFAPWRCRPGWSYHGRYSVHRCTPLPALLRSLPSAQSPRRLPTASLTGFDSPIVCSQNSVLLTPFGGSCFHTRRSGLHRLQRLRMTAISCASQLWFAPLRLPVMPEKVIPKWFCAGLRTQLKATIPVAHKPAQSYD